jgi:CRP-like cAMP-binding protein
MMKQNPVTAAHRVNRLLAAHAIEDYACLEPHLEVVQLPLGKVLYERGDPIDYAYFPHDAVISLLAVFQGGETAEMSTIGPEGVFGFVASQGHPDAFGRFTIQVPGAASRVRLDRLQDVLNACPSVRMVFTKYLQALMAQTFQIVACNAVHPVDARCCRWILTTQDRVRREELALTHEALAQMLGVQRSTVSSVTGRLQAAGLINQRRGSITVLNRAGLEAVACECYGTIRDEFQRRLPKTFSD